jgi:23S rRNA pseudouridine1911/1915/1917 synthase
VHLAEQAVTPILADSLYGGRPAHEPLASIANTLGRQALHAAVLGFTHPITRQRLCFSSALPDDMKLALVALRAV